MLAKGIQHLRTIRFMVAPCPTPLNASRARPTSPPRTTLVHNRAELQRFVDAEANRDLLRSGLRADPANTVANVPVTRSGQSNRDIALPLGDAKFALRRGRDRDDVPLLSDKLGPERAGQAVLPERSSERRRRSAVNQSGQPR